VETGAPRRRSDRSAGDPTRRAIGVNESQGARVLGPADGRGRAGMLGSMGVRFMLAGEETGGGFALVE
jgi:hypothetical protein